MWWQHGNLAQGQSHLMAVRYLLKSTVHKQLVSVNTVHSQYLMVSFPVLILQFPMKFVYGFVMVCLVSFWYRLLIHLIIVPIFFRSVEDISGTGLIGCFSSASDGTLKVMDDINKILAATNHKVQSYAYLSVWYKILSTNFGDHLFIGYQNW